MIRPFTPEDYPAVAEACRAAYSDANGEPLLPITEDEIRASDAERPDYCRGGRVVAELDGRIVGAAEFDQDASRFHPQKFWADVYVQRDFQGRGIGSALHDWLLSAVAPFDPIGLRGATREDLGDAVAFLERRGWREAKRSWESFLDLERFDPAPFAGVIEAVLAGGVEFRTLPELAADPERDRKLYELVWEVRQDLPDIDVAKPESMEYFVEHRLGAKELVPEAFFVAVQNGEYLGYTNHARFGDMSDTLAVGQTGVKRSARRRHIALALRLWAIEYGWRQGYRWMRTVNASTNTGMLAINRRLGYVARPAYIDFVRTFDAA